MSWTDKGIGKVRDRVAESRSAAALAARPPRARVRKGHSRSRSETFATVVAALAALPCWASVDVEPVDTLPDYASMAEITYRAARGLGIEVKVEKLPAGFGKLRVTRTN